MPRLSVVTGLVLISLVHDVSSFGIAVTSFGHQPHSAAMCPPLHARRKQQSSSASASQSAQPSRHSTAKAKSKPKKKNKYANFSKADNLSMDPLDAMINESRGKLQELHNEESKPSRRRRKKSSASEITSLEAVDQLLSSVDEEIEEEYGEDCLEVEKRERNKRFFPDTKTIDPYDPTTYGYIELGEWERYTSSEKLERDAYANTSSQ